MDQRIGEHAVDGNRRQRHPQPGLRTVDRAHEIADRDEPPARDQQPGETHEIARGERRGLRRLAGGEQNVFAPKLRHVDRNAEDDRSPESHAQRPAHHARSARPKRLRRQGCDRGHRPHAEHEAGEQDQLRKRHRRHRAVAEPPDQREVGGHHRDLAELRQRDRQRELGGRRDFRAPSRAFETERSGGCRRGDGRRDGHGAAP